MPLRSTHNHVFWLAPAPVVAKVGTGLRSNLRLEHVVASELDALDAPVVAPASEVAAGVHVLHDLEVTFWRYHPQDGAAEIDSARFVAALRKLHAALAGLSVDLQSRLPAYTHDLPWVRSLLTDPASIPALRPDDRRLLASTFDRLLPALEQRAPPATHRAIHGSPHSYNVLIVEGEPRFIDFETTCTGPMEWDLAHVEAGFESSYGDSFDRYLLWLCRSMASLKTAVLCWSDVERGDFREHAVLHLENIRSNVAPRLFT